MTATASANCGTTPNRRFYFSFFGFCLSTILLVLATDPASAATPANPYAGKQMFVNPDYVAQVESAMNKYPADRALLQKARDVSVAYWVDRIAKVPNVTRVLTLAQEQQTAVGKQVAVTVVIYDLPNRDCAAAASNGEIPCEDAQCANGLARYQKEYIDPIVSTFSKFPSLQIVAIVEPDSLPNLATNLGVPKCQQAKNAYEQGIAYALAKLSALSNVAIYIDCAHGGWLGWAANRESFANTILRVLSIAGHPPIRGFVSNVANYQALGSATSTADPCKLSGMGNPAIDEVHYVQLLDTTMSKLGLTGMGYVIDTSRNAAPADQRADCANWCNINNAGMGYRPTADTAAIAGTDIIDAFYWVKVPGESDGTSDSSAARFDFHCRSADSVVPAPEAGAWFPSFFRMLAINAKPAL